MYKYHYHILVRYRMFVSQVTVSLYRSNLLWSHFFLFPFWLPLEHEASIKLPVSLQFLNLGQSGGLLGRVISSLQDLYLHRTCGHIILLKLKTKTKLCGHIRKRTIPTKCLSLVGKVSANLCG
jgi:hypothetical protein